MLPQFKKDADGGLTFYIQHESPGANEQANWLPAPNGPFWIAMRMSTFTSPSTPPSVNHRTRMWRTWWD